jgi:hypothetical protein
MREIMSGLRNEMVMDEEGKKVVTEAMVASLLAKSAKLVTLASKRVEE